MMLRLIIEEFVDVIGDAPEEATVHNLFVHVDDLSNTFPELVVVTNPGCELKVVNVYNLHSL